MKNKLISSIFALATISISSANTGLYYIPNDVENNLPLTWTAGMDLIYDDNTTPGGIFDGDETFSLTPFIGGSFLNQTPQSTLEVYGRLGAIYYIDNIQAAGSEDIYTQVRAGLNYTHRFNERLRFVTRNMFAHELEPDYNMGLASTRQLGEYMSWQTDNSIGYRWTERVATYTGFQLTGLDFADNEDADRFTTTFYNQFRYQLDPQTVLTASYRHSEENASGLGADASNNFFLVGAEYRFSPTSILIFNTGAQMRSVDAIQGDDTTVPFLELTARSSFTEEFNLSTFVRFGSEPFDTVVTTLNDGLVRYDDRPTLRVGLTGDYKVSPSLTLNSGVNVIASSFSSGVRLPANTGAADADELLYNLYIGGSLRITDNLFATASYNFTHSDSDVVGRDFDRNRISVGIRADF